VDDLQRKLLELELRHHRERIAAIEATLRGFEEDLKLAADAPQEITRKAAMLRMELKGRRAAFSVGTAHLGAHSA
jgi:seryl-tRNA(Sec) selenium transferase